MRPKPDELKVLLREGPNVRVSTRGEHAPDAGRPYVELWQTARQPDGKETTQVFVASLEHFYEAYERVRALDPGPRRRGEAEAEEPRREGAKEPESKPRAEPSKELWPVVRVEQTLRTGAVVHVEKWFDNRDDAEKYAARWSKLAALNVPVSKEAARGDRLVVSKEEASPKLGKLIDNAREHERYHESKRQEKRQARAREERQRWSDRQSFGPEARSHSLGELVRSKTVGSTRADIFRRADETGRTHDTVLLTRPVKQADGSLRLVTTEHTPKELKARYAGRAEARGERPEGREKPQARPEGPDKPEPRPKPEQAREAKPDRTRQFGDYLERASQEERRHNQLGIWMGVEPKPRKNQLVQYVVGMEFDWKTGAIIEKPGRVYPVEGPVRSEPPENPVFVACERSAKFGFYQVLGFTRNQGLAEERIATREAAYQDRHGAELKEMYTKLLAVVEKHRPQDERLQEGLKQLLKELGPEPRKPGQGTDRHQARQQGPQEEQAMQRERRQNKGQAVKF